MNTDTKLPSFWSKAFLCPTCNAYAKMDWIQTARLSYRHSLHTATCQHCNIESIWRSHDDGTGSSVSSQMIFPDISVAVTPAKDMPDNVKEDFIEAKNIFNKSPKASAALLRLALQKLCIYLGEPGKNINTDIKSLVEKSILSANVTKAADTVRITGNNAVHPGEMDDQDIDHIAAKMFDLINFIVKKTITEPKELEEIYNKTPQGAREAITKRDGGQN